MPYSRINLLLLIRFLSYCKIFELLQDFFLAQPFTKGTMSYQCIFYSLFITISVYISVITRHRAEPKVWQHPPESKVWKQEDLGKAWQQMWHQDAHQRGYLGDHLRGHHGQVGRQGDHLMGDHLRGHPLGRHIQDGHFMDHLIMQQRSQPTTQVQYFIFIQYFDKSIERILQNIF